MRLSPEAGPELVSGLASGGPGAARRYVLWCAWQRLRADKAVPPKLRAALFSAMCKTLEVKVER